MDINKLQLHEMMESIKIHNGNIIIFQLGVTKALIDIFIIQKSKINYK